MRSAGVDWIVDRIPDGVTLCGARGTRDRAMAEWVVAALLADLKGVRPFAEAQAAHRWKRLDIGDLSTLKVADPRPRRVGRGDRRGCSRRSATEVRGVARRARDDDPDAYTLDQLPRAAALGRRARQPPAAHRRHARPRRRPSPRTTPRRRVVHQRGARPDDRHRRAARRAAVRPPARRPRRRRPRAAPGRPPALGRSRRPDLSPHVAGDTRVLRPRRLGPRRRPARALRRAASRCTTSSARATRMPTGGDELVAALERAGVEVVFGLPGVHNLPAWEALRTSLDPPRRRPPRAGRRLRGRRLRARHRQGRRRARHDRPGRRQHARRDRRGVGVALARRRHRHRHPDEPQAPRHRRRRAARGRRPARAVRHR